MRAALILVTAVALAVVAAPGAWSQVTEPTRQPMPALRLQDLDGNQVSTDEFSNSVVIFDFWATWCGPCITEIPFLNRLQAKYGEQGLKVVGVTMASGEAKEVKPLVSRFKMEYSILMGDDEQGYELNILGFPTTYLVTKDWKIYRKYIGAGPMKARQVEADVKKVLGLEAAR
jgi:thiol-disulfide isomerase/thioredoxin